MAFNSGRTDVDQARPLQMMHGVQTCSAADVARDLDIHWTVHRIIRDQLGYREVCAHGCQKILKVMTKLIAWECVGLSCIHLICYTDQTAQLWNWNMVNYTKPENRKRMYDKLPAPSIKEYGSVVIGKDDRGKPTCYHKHVLVMDFLGHGNIVCWLLFWYS